MTISRKSWKRFIDALKKISQKATDSMEYYVQNFGVPATQEELEDFIFASYNISTKYGEAAAELAAQMYDVIVDLSGLLLPPAVPAAPATYHDVAKTVVGTLKTGNTDIVSQAVGRLVKRAGVDTTVQNALRDGAQWAWIPQSDTCAFCITLASRGWQRASKKAIKNGHAEHIHANCDCMYAIRFDDTTNVEGYEPEKYLEVYQNAEGATPKDKINAMRREFYAANKENGAEDLETADVEEMFV